MKIALREGRPSRKMYSFRDIRVDMQIWQKSKGWCICTLKKILRLYGMSKKDKFNHGSNHVILG